MAEDKERISAEWWRACNIKLSYDEVSGKYSEYDNLCIARDMQDTSVAQFNARLLNTDLWSAQRLNN